MELKDLEDVVDNMIVQHNYPGFEPRSLHLALPLVMTEAPARLYIEALDSDSVYVRLAALRWFQTRSGVAKNHASEIAAQLEHSDSWVRLEAIRTIEIAKILETDLILKISSLLKDPEKLVRTEAAKASGNLIREAKKAVKTKSSQPALSSLEDQVISALKIATEDSTQDVRRKAIKSLRKLGAFSS